MRRNLEWFEGAPESLKPGMVIITDNGLIRLIGDGESWHDEIAKWAWLVTPAELEWLEAMATSNAKSRPEQ